MTDKVVKGSKIKLDYTGTLDSGEVFDSSNHDGHSHPLEFTAGEGMVIKGFDDAVIGMSIDESKKFRLEASDAYGDIREDLVREIPSENLPPEAKTGMTLGMKTPDGQTMPITIKSIDSEKKVAVLDFNHPLAGKALTFDIKVVSIE